MSVGVQFTGTVAANATQTWFTFNWNPAWHVEWNVVPTSPQAGNPQVEWNVQVQRSSPTALSYWISIHNLTAAPVNIEARYAIMS